MLGFSEIWKKYGLTIVIAAFLLSNGFSYAIGLWKGYDQGKQNEQIKVLTRTIKIKEKHDEIRNNRPDAAGVVKRLRAGTF